ncbi:tRNA epoxyqueuosine(34) reductase QueG [Methylogaea oryzae]|uniref:Epoxyqueuosine reductase n=1 Tax=Methylogaea oryzae TaxID=1295382 RepID=A0A8D4VQX0_9GAMM|nr:tRNA epoxyqueuosine(34) reductase QueG [Methylogaea oryzae]BBL71679.1 epoxyqueuosine reductase [Methylogaea oryzae]
MTPPPIDYAQLAARIKTWGQELGFQGVGIADIDLHAAEQRLLDWLARGFHGRMEYMQRHGSKRSRPAELVPGTISVVSVRMDYLPQGMDSAQAALDDDTKAYVSRYALGRDYHKLVRQRLQKLATRIEETVGALGYRVFCDSAPVLEKPIAEKAGLGWIGKHTNLIDRSAGSFFFLGEIYTDLPLPADVPAASHCGRCRACLDICPTAAIVAPYVLDARRCISYLTIELADSIPEEFRPALGNRIYGCDDCQLACPWNRFAQLSVETDFLPRHQLESADLLALFAWDEATFLSRTEGSPIRRIGHERWLRNLAVALGNARPTPAVIAALQERMQHPSALVREHVQWALARHEAPPK